MFKLKLVMLCLGMLILWSGFHKAPAPLVNECPSRSYEMYYAFNKILSNPKYKCYGQAISEYQAYYCPMYGKRCNGTYFEQSFCYDGAWYKLYHTEKACTCGCVGKNFHGKSLSILDVRPCVCDDGETNEEIIGKEDF
jgi:hypothetical protein